MANRFPLIIDGNQIKEIPDGDDLYLRNSNINEVKNITSLGIIEAAAFTVQGQPIQARNFIELNDVPVTYVGKEKYIVRVKEDGTGLEFADFQNLGEINFNNITTGTVTGDLKGSVFADDSTVIINALDNTANIGNLRFKNSKIENTSGELEIVSSNGISISAGGNIWISAGTKLIFEGTVPDEFEAKLQAAIITADRDIFLPDETGTLATREWVNLQQFDTDIKGSVFADDSTLLVDGTNGLIVGNSTGSIFNRFNSVVLLDTQTNTSYTSVRSTDGNNTLLVDAVTGNIPWNVISGAPSFNDGSNSLTLQALTAGTVTISNNIVVGNLNGDVYASNGTTKVLENNNGIVAAVFTGNVTGNVNGTLTGNVNGNVTGTLNGNVNGNVTGDVKGSIFANDSTLLVDAVNGGIPWDVIIGTPVLDVEIVGGVTVPVDNNFDINVENSVAGTSIFRITSTGDVQIPNTLKAFGINTDLNIVSNGTGSVSVTDGQNGITINGSNGNLDIISTGTVTVQGAAGSTVNIGTGPTGTITIGNGSNTIDFPAGTNIDFTGANITGNTASIVETDPIFTASAAADITQTDITNWNAAASSTESDTLESVTGRGATTTSSITVGGITTETLTITGTGTSTISGNEIVLNATTRTSINGSPFRVAQLSSTQRNALVSLQNGDIIYNITENKFQVRESGAWSNLTTSGSLEIPNYSFVDFSGTGTGTITTGNLLVNATPATVIVTVSVTFFNRIEITISGMMYYGGATGISDRTLVIERSINGGAYTAVTTAIGSPQGPTAITYVDTHGASNGSILTYRFRNTGTQSLIIDYSKANQIIAREV